ncbi:MAG: FHA domain-containing protein [Polyangiaceae bacterium]
MCAERLVPEIARDTLVARLGMALFDRWFGKGRVRERARRLEARGDWNAAIDAWIEADAPEEAARVFLLRAETEMDPQVRLATFARAVAVAPEGHDVKRAARVARATWALAVVGDHAVTETSRLDVERAAKELEEAGEPGRAARAWELLGRTEDRARALEAAGDVEGLERLYEKDARATRDDRARADANADFEERVATGRRREAVTGARAHAASFPSATLLVERVEGLERRRPNGPIVRVTLGSDTFDVAFGRRVVVGRGEGTIHVHSPVVSREHVSVERESGHAVVRDLGTHNGTRHRGLAIDGAMPIREALAFTLGRDVDLRVEPVSGHPTYGDGVLVTVAGTTTFAPLGPWRVPGTGWTLDLADDGWLELVTTDGARAFAGELAWASPATLVTGDAVARERGASPWLALRS